MILYHYTNCEAFNAILRQQALKPSLRANRPRDVQYGEGQYLTDWPPGLLDALQLSFLLVGNTTEAYRFTHYVAIETEGLTLFRGRQGVYVNRSRLNLDLAGRMTAAGPIL